MSYSNTYVQLPPNSSGSQLRCLSGSQGIQEVVTLADTNGNLYVPTSVGITGSVPLTVNSAVSGSVSITGSIVLPVWDNGAYLHVTGSLGRSWNLSTGSDFSTVVIEDSAGNTTSYIDTGSHAFKVNIVTGSSTIPVAVVSGNISIASGSFTIGSISGSVGITGSSVLPVVGAMSGSIGITGSTLLNAQVSLSGSTLPIGVTGSFTATIGAISGSVGITGSAILPVSLVGTAISGSIGITGSSVLTTQGSVGITGSSTLNVSVTGASVTQAISGSIGRTWSLSTGSDATYAVLKDSVGNTTSYINTANSSLNIYAVGGSLGRTWNLATGSDLVSATVTGGSLGLTGSSTLNVAIVSGSSTFNGIVSGSVGITGSSELQISITGSNILPVYIASGSSNTVNVAIVSGSSSFAGAISGSVGITGSNTLACTFQITGSTVAIQTVLTGSYCSNLLMTGSMISGTNTGVLLFASGSSSQKVKVYAADIASLTGVFSCFYFGNTTSLTANAFLIGSGSTSTRSHDYVLPLCSTNGQALYTYLSGSSSMAFVSVGYIVE